MTSEIEITEFLNNEYSEAALYMNYRAMPSYIDGLKNSGRKIVYVVKKKGLKEKKKVASLGAAIVDEAGYLHGNTSIEGAIVTRTQCFTGANNIPILKEDGNFGTRLTPMPSASRYIYTKFPAYFNELFVKCDDGNLINQEFEGDQIEPRFYVPTVPLLLVNGTEGIGVGVASTVLARDPDKIIRALRVKLNGKKPKRALFTPSWRGFTGEVTEVDNCKWEITGVADINKKKVTITELPISWSLAKYLDKLKEWKDEGIIEKFIDFSDPKTDTFKFELTLSSDEAKKPKSRIMTDLGLVETITENLTCVDENNAVVEFEDVMEVFDSYYNIKIEYMKKRIKSETNRLEQEAKLLSEKAAFILEVIKGTINMKEKKSLVESKMKKKGYTYIDKCISMPMYSMTEDKVKELLEERDDKLHELKLFKKETPESLWLKDLDNLQIVLENEGLMGDN